MAEGVTLFGENRVQEARTKIPEVGPGAGWHLVGHLQRNKAKEAARLFDMIHSVDSVDLLQELDRHAGAGGRRLDLLIQVNVAGEATKHGAGEEEVPGILRAAGDCRNVRIRGLMVIPPYDSDPERSRPRFRQLAELALRLRKDHFYNVALEELSMGMTEDFEVAVEEGATLVRIGRALFGERPARVAKENP
jgi:pyridoxal phosphate enzyme (YggS family)